MAVVAVTAMLMAAQSGAAYATPSRAQLAWEWIGAQLGTGTEVTSGSLLEPDEDYPATWTGPVSGTTTLIGVPEGTEPDELEIRALVVTDRAYHIATAPLHEDGSFSFEYSHPGAKVFHLADPASGAVLAEHAPDTGLVRSYDVPEGSSQEGRTFCYDQALALLAALSMGDGPAAETLARGLMAMQSEGGAQDGAFPTSAAALYPQGGLPEYRTGNNSFAAYALLRYLDTLPAGDAHRTEVRASALRAVEWLLHQQQDGGALDGLLTGGYGGYTPEWTFDPGVRLPWASTEHNIDAWHTLRLAERVLDHDGAGAAADRLAVMVPELLWDSETDRFLQGRSPDGPDAAEALDVNSWGAIFLDALGEDERADAALRRTGVFASATTGTAGYAPLPSPQPPLVWTEGTAGVALAQLRLGDARAARATIDSLGTADSGSGAWPGASRDDESMSMTSVPAVGAAAWVLLVERGFAGGPSIWDQEGEPAS